MIALLLAASVVAASPADVVRGYYRSLASRDYAAAWVRWSDGGKASGHSLAAFRRGFATTRATRVTITGPVETEGAAGSLYATVPVRIDATDTAGRSRAYAGAYVLRRINDVDGATAEQRRWHIASAEIHPVR